MKKGLYESIKKKIRETATSFADFFVTLHAEDKNKGLWH